MTSKDVVEMYKKGFSIDYIVKEFYRYKTRNDIPNHKFRNTYIITKKSVDKESVKQGVYEIILKFAVSNKAN